MMCKQHALHTESYKCCIVLLSVSIFVSERESERQIEAGDVNVERASCVVWLGVGTEEREGEKRGLLGGGML